MRHIRLTAAMMAVVALLVTPAAGMAATAPKKAPAPVAAPSQFDQGYAAYSRGDFATALSLWRPLADQGNADAQGNLGVMYAKGQGVPQDYVQAHKWYNLGSARATAAEVRDRNAKNRDIVAAKMTPAQIAEAQRLASAWNPTQ